MREYFLSPDQCFKVEQLGFKEDCIACFILDHKTNTEEMQFNLLSNQYTVHPSLKGRVTVSPEILKWINGITNAFVAPLKEQALNWIERTQGLYGTIDWEEKEGKKTFYIKWTDGKKEERSGEFLKREESLDFLVDVLLDMALYKRAK
jgi:hypothetical protein